MKSIISFIIFSFLLIMPAQAIAAPVVFFLPHQDDETILAGTIAKYIKEERDVKAVMVTNGSASEVLPELIKKGFNYLTRTVFVARRNDEFFRVMLKLGVKKENILFANPGGKGGSKKPKYRDTYLTKEQAEEVISNAYQRWGEGIYITITGSAGNSDHPYPDHEALELALKNFPVKEKYFYTDQIDKGEVVGLPIDVLERKRQALDEYFVWEPSRGKFAIGAHSIADRLQFWQNHPFEYRLK